ncbi:MAG: hypothetical protein M3P40_05135 [Actinomycetota bacterium]|nr:hypothetical protein [Actinomycetota bacterium]
MRMFRLETKCFVALAAAISLLMAMNRPWYGKSPADDGGPSKIEDLASASLRWFGESDGTTAWQSFGGADNAIAALTVVCGAAALACLSESAERIARGALQLATLGLCGLLVLKLIDEPQAAWEPRYGIFVALGLAVVLATIASGINETALRSTRRRAYDTL